jgi:SAM-dependent methyltransferase
MKLSELKVLYKSGVLSKSEYIQKAYMEFHSTLFDYIEITESTDVKEIRIAPDGVSFFIGDEFIKLYAPQQEARVAPLEIMNFAHYEPEEMRIMDLLSVGTRNILDIGANIGLYSIRFAKLIPNARVFSFEPMPASFAYLQRNIASNSVGDRITSFNYGLSKANGAVEFFPYQ